MLCTVTRDRNKCLGVSTAGAVTTTLVEVTPEEHICLILTGLSALGETDSEEK